MTCHDEICDNCYDQETSMHTIDFAVEEAIFRKQRDIHSWTATRWHQERREFRARRMARLIKENREHIASKC